MDPIPPMLAALDAEIAKIKAKGGSNVVEILGGVRGTKVGERTLYAFPLRDDLRVRDDAPVRVKVAKQEIDGVVVSLIDRVLTLALDQDIGARIAIAQLVLDDSFLLVRLRERLEEAGNGSTLFHRNIADQVIGIGNIRSGSSVAPFTFPEHIDEAKRHCVSVALGSSATFVWGPPGTGKTTALGLVVQGLFQNEESVLLVSNTNVAVDTALEKICEQLDGSTELEAGQVLRLGPIVKPELETRFGKLVGLDAVSARLAGELETKRRQLRDEQQRIEVEIAPHQEGINRWYKLAELEEQLLRLLSEFQVANEAAQRARDELAALEAKERELQGDLARALATGTLGRLFRGLNPEKLRAQIEQVRSRVPPAQVNIETATEQVRTQEEGVADGVVGVDNAKAEVSGLPPRPQLLVQVTAFRARLGEIGRELSRIEAEIAAIRVSLIEGARVIATTAYQSYLSPDLSRDFDVVVIDEASMLPLPLSYYAAGRGKGRVIVAGDFRQLPPIVLAEREESVKEWMKKDVFEKSGIPEHVRAGTAPDSLVALRTQFRMREPICELINRVFYKDSPLTTGDNVLGRAPIATALGTASLYLVDTTDLQPWAAYRSGTYSRYNLLHAVIARNLVRRLAGEPDGEPPDEPLTQHIGVVAPYAAQGRLIQTLLLEDFEMTRAPTAATAHRFQGNEKTVMIVDLTDSLGARLGRFMKSHSVDEDGARLLNVALSRARDQIVVLANVGFLERKAPKDGTVSQVLRFLRTNAEALDARDVLSWDEASWFQARDAAGQAKLEFDESSAALFSEASFYDAFEADVRNARRSVVIFSPFATQRGTSRWADLFRALAERGIQVRVVTRPEGDQGGILEHGLAELLKGLGDIGVTVDRRDRLHEKAAIVDGRIMWHGSLNILSHRDTTESMMRIEGEAAAEQLADFLVTPETRRSAKGDSLSQALAEEKNPPCPNCEGLLVWATGRYGPYFKCPAGCPNVNQRDLLRRQGKRDTPSAESRVHHTCPECGKSLTRKNGRYGTFLGCSGYPSCTYTKNLRKKR